tara:strand:+ start:203 stop:1318 length:1116 start_codon:yes stop_codon:yes gene_type:complete
MKKKYSWFEPSVGNLNNKYLQQCLKENFPNEGNITYNFLDLISKKIGSKFAVGTTSGTTAIYLALKSLDIGHGDEVIIPNITFIATANAVKMAGATPIILDTNELDLNINVNLIEDKITKKTKAIIPVHVSGKGADIIEILKIAKKNKIYVIEDSAESLFSKFKGKYLGTYGELGCFSLAPNKILTTGQGGIITTNSKKLYLKLIRLKDQGRTKRGNGGDDIHNYLGYNFKLTNIQASIGMMQMKNINKRISRLKRNYSLYVKYLKNIKSIKIISFDINKGELPLWTCLVCNKRNDLVKFLEKFDIECRNFWLPINHQRPYKASLKTIKKDFKISSTIYKKVFWLPSSYNLKDKDIIYISKKIISYFAKYE